MNTMVVVLTVVGSALGIMVTFILGTYHVSNRFGRVETRLAVIESKIGIRGE